MTVPDQLLLFTKKDAVARHSDPETSWLAAKSILNIRQDQANVWLLLRKYGPLTDEGILDCMYGEDWRLSPSGCRTRRKELVDLGLVDAIEEEGSTALGNKCNIWRALSYDEWRAGDFKRKFEKEDFK